MSNILEPLSRFAAEVITQYTTEEIRHDFKMAAFWIRQLPKTAENYQKWPKSDEIEKKNMEFTIRKLFFVH